MFRLSRFAAAFKTCYKGDAGAARRFSTQAEATNAFSKVNRNAAFAAAAGLGVMLVVGAGADDNNTLKVVFNDAPVVAESGEVQPEVADQIGAAELDALKQDIKKIEASVNVYNAASLNRAFVFIKPHAANEKVDGLVKTKFNDANVHIVKEGELSAEEIDSKKLIDIHYGAIASKAVLLKPSELNVPAKGKAQFKKMFGLSWEDALAQGKVFNAKDGAEKLGVDADGLDSKWATLNRGENLIKFGGGFYCGQIDEDTFIMNGFYMSLRTKYTAPGAHIHYYLVEWDPNTMTWGDFRGKLLGATDPTEAEEGSLRREIYNNWEALGLSEVPNTGDNGMHGSASPFEAMAERVNWVGSDVEKDPYANGLLAVGIKLDTIKEWMADAQVKWNDGKSSVFDLLEDTDSAECMMKAVVINSQA